jgi:hypothetical protein
VSGAEDPRIGPEQYNGLRRWLIVAVRVYGGPVALANAVGCAHGNIDYWRKRPSSMKPWVVLAIWLTCPEHGRAELTEAWTREVAGWPSSIPVPSGTVLKEASDVLRPLTALIGDLVANPHSTSETVEITRRILDEAAQLHRRAESEHEDTRH